MDTQALALSLDPEPHLVVVRGVTYCYTCDEEIENPRRDGKCPRQAKSEDGRAYRGRLKEVRQWPTS